MNPNLRTLFLIPVFLLFASCSSLNPFFGNKGPVSKQIGPAGGTITSVDGKVVLTFPEGALSANELITIEKISPKNLGAEFDEIKEHHTISSAYELSPDGLEFAVPVQAFLISDQNAKTQESSAELHAEVLVSSRNGVVQVLKNPGIRLDTNSKVTVYGQLSGFSKLVQVGDLGYTVSTVTSEDIEQTPNAGRTLQSVVSITSRIKDTDNNASIRQHYQNPLSFVETSDIESIEVLKGPQGTLYGSRRTFTYRCTGNGEGLIVTNTDVTFGNDFETNILQNLRYKAAMGMFANCEIPESSEDEFEFSISDLKATFDTAPGRLSLNFSYNVSPENAENTSFKIDYGDGNIKTYEPTGPETTLGQTGPTDIYKYEDTHVFKVGYQYKLAGEFDITVEARGYDNPEALNNLSSSSLRSARQLGNRWVLRADKIMAEWEGFSHSYLPSFGPEDNIAPRVPTTYTPDGHVKITWKNFDRFQENQSAVIPVFSVEKIDLFENFWIYQLKYPTEFTERFDLNPNFSYSEFPNEEGIQPLEFELDLDQAVPVIIQLDELWNPVLIDDMSMFDPNRPTRLIAPNLFEKLQQEQKIFDFEETTVEVPGHKLRVIKDGSGSGTVLGSVDTGSNLSLNEYYRAQSIVVSNVDVGSILNPIRCGDMCSYDFTEGTGVTFVAVPDPGSKFVQFSENTTPLEGSPSVSSITIEENIDVTATFIKNEGEESDTFADNRRGLSNPVGPIVKDRAQWFDGDFRIGADFGYPLRYNVKNFIEDQPGLMDAEVKDVSPTIGGSVALINLVTKRGISTGVRSGFSWGRFAYEQNFNDGTEANGDVRVFEFFTGIGASVDLGGSKATPDFETGLNTVLNKSEIEFRDPFTNNIEKVERNHIGYNFRIGGGINYDLNRNFQISAGIDANFGGADSFVRPRVGVAFQLGGDQPDE